MQWPADAQFLWQRALGWLQRGLASLRVRGLAGSWRHLRQRRRPAYAPIPLWQPPEAAFAPFALASSDTPRASLVIPVHGGFAHTLRCLRALAAHPPATPFEVIVVDDASPDDTLDKLRRIGGLRVHARAANGGFIAACNDGARLARGEFLVLLNNDTVPQPGWLDALLGTFAAYPDAGLVGARLVYPDGRLQEAGGVVFADGSAWNYGRGEDPQDCRFTYLREADYVSGAAIALPTALLRQLGGLDARYAPAYYEDTDLAFAVRAAGRRVLYQPASTVVHVEGATAGTDPASGAKAAQARNRGVFAAKWAHALTAQPAPGQVPTPALLHARQPQVLVIDANTPRPDHDSGSLRMVELMRLLREEGAHVVFWPANRQADGDYTRALQQLGVECWHAPWAPPLPVWLRRHGARFASVLASRHYVAAECLPLLRRHAPQARLLFDTVDLHFLREERQARLAGDAAGLRAAERTRRQELALAAAYDCTLVVSPAERALLEAAVPGARIEVLSNLHRVAPPGPGFGQRRDLLFVGGFRHPPNVDAVCWFVREVWPLLHAADPALRFHCIGAEAPPAVQALADVPGVQVHGHVPDLAPWLARCRIAVAPLRVGAGVKGKITQALMHGLPVVATPLAAEGMALRDGEHVLLAQDAPAFAQAVLRLLHDAALWERLAAHGRALAHRQYSVEAARAPLRRLLLGS
ncbi:glycosyltransferase [Thermomonas alba]|uniref:glycosyltransferase n=1 Tax=Thermomonas alba TaxID=2888525 RepID=UPI001F04E0FC|nr:glycosyltransferase [Thermomonas alba]